MTTSHDRAAALLGPIWRGIDPEFKQTYKYEIWRIFEDQVRAAAYTTTLSLFLSRICSRMRVTLHEDTLPTVQEIVRGGQDRDILRVLREETAYCVTVVRLQNEERKEKRTR